MGLRRHDGGCPGVGENEGLHVACTLVLREKEGSHVACTSP